MVERREFLKGSVVAVSALALGLSSSSSASQAPAFAGVVYTKDNPGKWAAKVKSHAPEVNAEGGKVAMKTVHPMSAEHYIVRHSLEPCGGTVVGGKTFQSTDKAYFSFGLPAGYKGKVFATSFCNKHDFWLTEFSV